MPASVARDAGSGTDAPPYTGTPRHLQARAGVLSADFDRPGIATAA